MIVQCELCATRFKLDDSKIKDDGVRVRCSKCRNIFIVRQENRVSSADPAFDSFLNNLIAGTADSSKHLEDNVPDDSAQAVDDENPGSDTSEDAWDEPSFSPESKTFKEDGADSLTRDESASHYRTFSEIAADEPPAPAQVNRKLADSRLPFALTLLSVVVVIALAGAGIFFMNKGPALSGTPAMEKSGTGVISIRSTAGEFLVNSNAGELFVIKGEAVVNAGSTMNGPLQIKASLYDAQGTVLASKNVYCGTSLTREQLTTVPMNELESAIGKQTGDATAKPVGPAGKAIPFTVLFQAVPKSAAEFGIEVIDSKGSGK